MRLSDYVANFIADLGITHTFGVVGGGAMYLNDSFGHHERLKYVACHHEQAASFAAEAYSRLHGLGCALVTTGPGGSNSITGVCCAWVDSIPVLYISGQVPIDNTIRDTGLRQFGVQETNIVTLVKSITKYAVTITDRKDIRYELMKAVHIARSGRPGPIWIDVPLDIQSKQIDPEILLRYSPNEIMTFNTVVLTSDVFGEIETTSDEVSGRSLYSSGPTIMDVCLSMLRESKRPVLIVGNGVRLAEAQAEIRELVNALGIPVITSWSAADMIDSPYHIGHMGLFGDRASNFTVQNADLLLVIGCRMSVPMIGYRFDKFAPNAKIIMVDIDSAELNKPSLHVDLKIECDAREFIVAMLQASYTFHSHTDWLLRCQALARKYPNVLPEYAEQKDGINSYHFIDLLSKHLPDDAVVVTDMGTAFTGTFQAAKMKFGQRWLTASGHAPMGYGLPGAIGAHYATGKKVICIVGDGAFQFNAQELATIAHHKLPIIIFVLSNGGYLTITHMQDNHFGRRVGSDKDSGVSFPDVMAIGSAYDIPHICFLNNHRLEQELEFILSPERVNEPLLIEIMMPPNQPLIPRVQSRKNPDGSVSSGDISEMYPFLPREEFPAITHSAKPRGGNNPYDPE